MRHPKAFSAALRITATSCQASHYLDVVEGRDWHASTGFSVYRCRKTRPFSTAVYMADQAMIDFGKQQAREDLNNIAQWIADGKFPGYSERVEEISLPKWMLPKEDGSPADHQPIELY